MAQVLPMKSVAAPISGISVIPDWGMGHPEPRGNTHGAYSQSDVVDAYVATLSEELDSETVRIAPVNTRVLPGIPPGQRVKEAAGGHVPLICSCDFYLRERPTNGSLVEYSGSHLKQLAYRISESLWEWGRCSAFDHRGSEAVAINESDALIRIKPFALNGPNADDYLLRLDQLGVAIGRAIGDYFGERNLLRRRR